MGAFKAYILIVICLYAGEVNSFDFNHLWTSGIGAIEEAWNKVSNLLSTSFETVKQHLKEFLFIKSDDPAFRLQKLALRRVKNRGANVRRKTPEIFMKLGYRLESHLVLTHDGYILHLHRVLLTGSRSGGLANKTALVHHGLLGSSADWLLAERDHSLPFLLCSEGYDVWLANARGNDFSNAHITRSLDSDEFWNFSFQEMGQYDLPAVVDYIIKVKKEKLKIDFVGHSMGASAFLVLTSTMPRYQDFFKTSVLLAPLAYMSHTEGPLKSMATIPEEELKAHGTGEFFAKRTIPRWIAMKYCGGVRDLCSNPLFFLTGIPRVTAQVLQRLQKFVPAGGSTKTIIHYSKLIKNGLFTSFMGSEFPIGKITVPVFLMSAHGDIVASVEDVSKLFENLGTSVHHHVIVKTENFSHTDFLYSSLAKELVFDTVLEYLKKGKAYNLMETNEIV